MHVILTPMWHRDEESPNGTPAPTVIVGMMGQCEQDEILRCPDSAVAPQNDSWFFQSDFMSF